jgi:hypothetical protein
MKNKSKNNLAGNETRLSLRPALQKSIHDKVLYHTAGYIEVKK